MKSNLNFAAASTVVTPRARAEVPALSLRNGTEHGPAVMALGPAVRLPVLPRNRAYLKALREAELAAWETAKPLTGFAAAATQPKPARLPSPERQSGESLLYALLAGLALVTLGYQLRTLLISASGWHDFVAFVQQNLT